MLNRSDVDMLAKVIPFAAVISTVVAKQPSAPAASPAALRELPWGQLK